MPSYRVLLTYAGGTRCCAEGAMPKVSMHQISPERAQNSGTHKLSMTATKPQ